jgi:molybdate transport system substrate-binding protein
MKPWLNILRIFFWFGTFWIGSFGLSLQAQAEPLKVAVASNFIEPMRELMEAFEQKTEHKVVASYGSSAKLTIQIEQGAPFDVLMSADADKPSRLVEIGLGQAQYKQTYAIGRLALVSHRKNVTSDSLCKNASSKLSIANPALAPYGVASMEYVMGLPCRLPLSKQFILGENIGQAFHFFAAGATDYALVALSQVKTRPDMVTSHWLVPDSLHKPIVQDMVILKRTKYQDIAYQWFMFIQSAHAQQIVQSFGYQSFSN